MCHGAVASRNTCRCMHCQVDDSSSSEGRSVLIYNLAHYTTQDYLFNVASEIGPVDVRLSVIGLFCVVINQSNGVTNLVNNSSKTCTECSSLTFTEKQSLI
jgi:hypothetical protein